MTDCRVRPPSATSGTPSLGCDAEIAYRVGALVTELRESPTPTGELRRRAEDLLETGTTLLAGMSDGAERVALARGLSALEGALSRRVREHAIASTPAPANRSPVDNLLRGIERAARARVPRGSTDGFVQSVAGKTTMAQLRMLGTLERAEVRERLARLQSETTGADFLSDAEIDAAMARIDARLSQRFENAVRERAVRGLHRSAERFERMTSDPTGPEMTRLCTFVREGRADGLLDQLERVGADVRLLRQVNELAKSGANVSANVEDRVVDALDVAAACLREQAATVAGWTDREAMRATRTFSEVKQQVAQRMALGGIVRTAVEDQVVAAEQHDAGVDTAISLAWFAANVVVGLATGGSSVAVSIASSAGVGLLEGALEARSVREQAGLAGAAGLAGLVDEAQAARAACEAAAAESPMSLLQVGVGTLLGQRAGDLVEPVAGRVAGAVIDAGSGVDFEAGCEAR